MKQFLYLDTDIVNSIIAQSEKGIITGFSTEEENGEQKSTNKSISGNLEGDAGGKLLKSFLMQSLNLISEEALARKRKYIRHLERL